MYSTTRSKQLLIQVLSQEKLWIYISHWQSSNYFCGMYTVIGLCFMHALHGHMFLPVLMWLVSLCNDCNCDLLFLVGHILSINCTCRKSNHNLFIGLWDLNMYWHLKLNAHKKFCNCMCMGACYYVALLSMGVVVITMSSLFLVICHRFDDV